MNLEPDTIAYCQLFDCPLPVGDCFAMVRVVNTDPSDAGTVLAEVIYKPCALGNVGALVAVRPDQLFGQDELVARLERVQRDLDRIGKAMDALRREENA